MIFGFIYASACVKMNINNINNININPHCDLGAYASDMNMSDKRVSFNGKREARQFLRWMSKNFSSPQQRAILGVTALCTQPFIDLHNKHIKEEDKPVVVAKTISKIIVGTTVGVIMRHQAIKAIKNYTKEINTGKFSQCLLPKKIVEMLRVNPNSVSKDYLNNYRNGFGTFMGLCICLVTNFLIDAPLTKILTNIIHEKVFKKEGTNVK